MTKLGWKLLFGESNSAKECVTSKYMGQNYITSHKKRLPFIKDVGKSYPLLHKSLAWKRGHGDRIKFYDDNWLRIGTIRNIILGPFNLDEESLTVNQLIVNNQWNLSQISILLLTFILDRILSMTIPFHHMHDRTFSTYSHSRKILPLPCI